MIPSFILSVYFLEPLGSFLVNILLFIDKKKAFIFLFNIQLDINVCAFMFRYTPISDPDSKGYFDLLIKV